MVVCKYFIEGRCRFGNSCQYEHSGQPSSSSSSFSSTHHQQQSRSTGQNNIYSRLGFSNLRKDLIEERPIYRYSVFAPMKDEPNMIEGTDFSPEELRLEYYNINNTYGNDAQYVRAQQGVRDLEERMQSKIDSILKDVSGACNEHELKKQQSKRPEQLECLFETYILNTLKMAMSSTTDFVYHENTETFVTKTFHWTVSNNPTVLDPEKKTLSIISIKSEKDLPLNEKDFDLASDALHRDNDMFGYHVENVMKEMHKLKTFHGVLTTCKHTWFLRYQPSNNWFFISPAIKSDATPSLIKCFIYFTLSSKYIIGSTREEDYIREKSVNSALARYNLSLSILRG
ncbi:5337_t:CDS:2 [Entrophospora sp. SA101]|nr:5337_t:CDS:2 [Entrophospora sp. SA101]